MRTEKRSRVIQRQLFRRGRAAEVMMLAMIVACGFAVGAALLVLLPPDDQSPLFFVALLPVALSFTFFRSRE